MVDILRNIGDALIGTQYPFGSLAPIDRQQTIGNTLMSLGGNISQAGAQGVGPMAALGQAWGNLNDRGADRVREMLLGEKVKDIRSERERQKKQDEFNRRLFGDRDQGAEPGGYAGSIKGLESGGDYGISNKLGSGAYGAYQFMPETWLAVRASNPDLGLPENIAEATPEQQDAAFEAFTRGNAGQLKSTIGREPTQLDLYMAHRFGAGGAGKLLRMDPNTPMAAAIRLVFPKNADAVIRQNPDLASGTIADFQARYASKFGDQQPYQVAQADTGTMTDAAPTITPTGGVTPAPSGGTAGSQLDQMSTPELYRLQAQLQATGNEQGAEAVGTIIKGREAGSTDDIKEYNLYLQQEAAAGRQPLGLTDWMKEIKGAGASRQTVTVGGEKIPDALLKSAIETSDRADLLEAQVNELELFRDLAADAPTGRLAPVTLPIKQAFKDIGIELGDDVPLLEALQAQQNQMALRLRNPESGFGLTGNTSNRDITFLKDAVAGIEKTPEGNRAILTIMLAKQRREAQIARLKSDFVFENGTLKGWGDVKKEFVENAPFFTPEERELLTSLKQQAQSQESVTGAPEPSTVEDGYRFKGGNPADPNSWERVQ